MYCFPPCQNILRIRHTVCIKLFRNICVQVAKRNLSKLSTYCRKNHQYQVLISKANDIYSNLAFEEWLYDNTDMAYTTTLLMWKNKPCVVIGRHQNPWLECNVGLALENSIDIARRSSGGGTVYHDEGNLNCSFIKHKETYNRVENLELIINAIKSQWEVDISHNCREDIILDKMYKISGTASRLARERTFHHLTLLYNANIEHLQKYLNSPISVGINSRATASRVSQVKNLSENFSDMTFTSLTQAIGKYFLSVYQPGASTPTSEVIKEINPTDETKFPDIDSKISDMKEWDWIYGKTPKFSLERTYTSVLEGFPVKLNILASVDKGYIQDLSLFLNGQSLDERFLEILHQTIVGQKFMHNDTAHMIHKYSGKNRFQSINSFDMDAKTWIFRCLHTALCQ